MYNACPLCWIGTADISSLGPNKIHRYYDSMSNTRLYDYFQRAFTHIIAIVWLLKAVSETNSSLTVIVSNSGTQMRVRDSSVTPIFLKKKKKKKKKKKMM